MIGYITAKLASIFPGIKKTLIEFENGNEKPVVNILRHSDLLAKCSIAKVLSGKGLKPSPTRLRPCGGSVGGS